MVVHPKLNAENLILEEDSLIWFRQRNKCVYVQLKVCSKIRKQAMHLDCFVVARRLQCSKTVEKSICTQKQRGAIIKVI